jgi:hypothetical protein
MEVGYGMDGTGSGGLYGKVSCVVVAGGVGRVVMREVFEDEHS